jgi:hypothetical protein
MSRTRLRLNPAVTSEQGSTSRATRPVRRYNPWVLPAPLRRLAPDSFTVLRYADLGPPRGPHAESPMWWAKENDASLVVVITIALADPVA